MAQNKTRAKHSFTYSTLVYSDVFNSEKDKVDLWFSINNPAFSYSIRRKELKITAFFNTGSSFYHPVNYYNNVTPPFVNGFSLNSFGIVPTIFTFRKKKINLSSELGAVYSDFYALRVLSWYGPGHPRLASYTESRFSIAAGLTIEMPIYKSVYFASSTRFAHRISKEETFNTKNLMIDAGIGITLERKKSK